MLQNPGLAKNKHLDRMYFLFACKAPDLGLLTKRIILHPELLHRHRIHSLYISSAQNNM